MGYSSGLVIGVVVGNVVTKKQQHWFVRTKKVQHKMQKRQLCRTTDGNGIDSTHILFIRTSEVGTEN
uniref:Uncharacterized protein n=1 Tax=Quercus lobata TaxID=97700 RepID=A0A7N2L6F8_QUELO